MQSGRILLTTSYCDDYYDYFEENVLSGRHRITYPRINSYGLRFIKQNTPDISILEYPTWNEYCQIVARGWDVVGFSFLTPDIPKIKRMAEFARQLDVPQLWGDATGAWCPKSPVSLTRSS